jgi:ATP/maltotriose-dependent transcriptional regulator MalT
MAGSPRLQPKFVDHYGTEPAYHVYLSFLLQALVRVPKYQRTMLLEQPELQGEGLAKDVLNERVGTTLKAKKRRIAVIDLAKVKVTARDQEVLNLLVQGCSNKEIASHLRISPRTVKQHLRTLFLRAGIRDGRKRVRLATAEFQRSELQS